MVRIKICGITNKRDALLAAESGAHAVGFVFAASPRRIDPAAAREIVKILPPFISKVGVFVNEDSELVKEVADLCGLDLLQLHGDESPAYCSAFSQQVIKAIRVKDRSV